LIIYLYFYQKFFHNDLYVLNRRQKKIIFALGAFSIALLVAVIVLASFLSTSKSTTKDENVDVRCTTRACIRAANEMFQNMNTSVDPCDDFFQFSCGSFVQNQRIPEDQSSQTLFGILRKTLTNGVSYLLEEPITNKDIISTKNAKRLYRSCIDEAQIELTGEQSFLKFIQDQFGEWPALNTIYDPQSAQLAFDPMASLVKFRLYGFRQLVDVRIEINPKNSSLYILKARQPTWFLNKDYYNVSIANSARVIKAYKNYAKTFLTYMNKDTPVADSVIDGMYKIESDLGVVSFY
jgi:neprilysin